MLAVLERVDPSAQSARDPGANPLDRLARGVFVGRGWELERLREALDEAFAGRGSVVTLVGEPGIGKTRTAQELETYARMRGATVVWGRSHEAAGAPAYWPWVQIARAATAVLGAERLWEQRISGVEELARILPELRELPGFVEPKPITDPESAQFRLFDTYTRMVRQFTEHAPLLLVLDDLHWADKPTLLLLLHLARELPSLQVLVVGTYRDTELTRQTPLSEALAELTRIGLQRVSLRGLSRNEVGGYIEDTARVEPWRELLDRIFEETEGNPFFVSEVVNLMTEEDNWSADSLSDIPIPESVPQTLGRRLDRISEEANALLTVAAVVGREFTYHTLTLLEERDDETLLRLIEEGLNARVIEESAEVGRFRFTHALMQETLLDELSTTRRVRLHGRIGQALEARYGERADERAVRLAQHFLEAATLTQTHAARAARYSRLAAEQAEAAAAWTEAIRHYEAAIALVTETPGSDGGRSGNARGCRSDRVSGLSLRGCPPEPAARCGPLRGPGRRAGHGSGHRFPLGRPVSAKRGDRNREPDACEVGRCGPEAESATTPRSRRDGLRSGPQSGGSSGRGSPPRRRAWAHCRDHGPDHPRRCLRIARDASGRGASALSRGPRTGAAGEASRPPSGHRYGHPGQRRGASR